MAILLRLTVVVSLCVYVGAAMQIAVPPTSPSTAVPLDPALLSVSIEFFTFPAYMEFNTTRNCLKNIAASRGSYPAVRIGGTTQDRATYDPTLDIPVNYTVSDPDDAPASLSYGPAFFDLASEYQGNVTIGLNRQLNNSANTLAAAVQAKASVPNLFAVELGNEPEYWASDSPIIPPGTTWTPGTDGASQKSWFSDFSLTVGSIFQAAVYLEYPTWSTAGLIPLLGDALNFVKTFSGHSYPQSACGGASTNLPSLMSHSSIVSYTKQYNAEASAALSAGRVYFLGETNSATCGGGGISPTFGAALWIVDYVLQGALNKVQRLYFHQGTIGNCAYCFWGASSVAAPFYGAAFVSQFLGVDGDKLSMLDDGTGSVAVYAVYSSLGLPTRLLVYNSDYYDGTGSRSEASVVFSGLSRNISGAKSKVLRLSAPNATATNSVSIGWSSSFDEQCLPRGEMHTETLGISNGSLFVDIGASEAAIIFFQ